MLQQSAWTKLGSWVLQLIQILSYISRNRCIPIPQVKLGESSLEHPTTLSLTFICWAIKIVWPKGTVLCLKLGNLVYY